MSYPEALTWFIILYLAITGGGLFGIYHLSRIWRIVIYVLLGAGHIFCAFLWHGLSFIDRNNEFTEQTISWFNELAEQLHNGMIHEVFIQPPSLVWGAVVSGLSLLALAGGAVLASMKQRWWTLILIVVALLLSTNCFSFARRNRESDVVAEQNELRQYTYDVVKQKRLEGVPDTLLAETITIQMKDFRGTYENRTEAKASAEKIWSALRELKPETASAE
ncbi:MAG: hypothetical protein IKN52_00980 [Victivallales bacterium]|nr:hypothetical protein [Victivallales bacterium]